MLRYLLLLILFYSPTHSQCSECCYSDSTQSKEASELYTQLLLTTIQTNSDGESALKSTIIEVRIYALGIVLGLLALSRPIINSGKVRVYVSLALTILILFIWFYDIWNNDMLYRYLDRSERIVHQLEHIRIEGVRASMHLPQMADHYLGEKICWGFTCIGLFWYGGVIAFAWIIIHNQRRWWE